jgi:hypothetical protein
VITTLDIDQICVVKKTATGFRLLGNTNRKYEEYLEKYFAKEDGLKYEYGVRIEMSSVEEKKVRQKSFNSIGIPFFIHGVLLSYILYIRDKINILSMTDLLIHSG